MRMNIRITNTDRYNPFPVEPPVAMLMTVERIATRQHATTMISRFV
jgi:hypothetical protein